MAKRDAFGSFLRAAARAAAAAQREHQREIRAQLTEGRRIERQARMARTQQAREHKEMEKLARQQYLDDRLAETQDLNAELAERLEELQGILTHTLTVDDRISFAELRITEPFERFVAPVHLAPGTPPSAVIPPPPSGISKFFPGSKSKHEEAVQRAQREYQEQLNEFNKEEAEKRTKFAALRKEYEERKARYEAEVARKSAEVDEFMDAYHRKEVDAVVAYTEMVLARSEYPTEGFPQKFRVAYNPDSKELVVEYDLPEASVVPEVTEYRYVKTKDTIESKARKPVEIKHIYRDVIASVALRTIHEVIEADQADAVAVVTFTGIVDAIDPSNGHEVRVPVLSVRTSKSDFTEIRLDKVDMAACLKNLGRMCLFVLTSYKPSSPSLSSIW